MAVEPTNLISSTARTQPPRIAPDPDGVKVCTFANVGAAPLHLKVTPVAYDTTLDFWVAWETGGANGRDVIRGFLYPEDLQTHATNEVQAQVMTHGVVHRDDIAIPTGQAQGPMDTALKDPATRTSNLKIQGLDEVRY